jgi:hypothetical protein
LQELTHYPQPKQHLFIQEYVGTLSNNVTVTYPPVVAFYVVSNQVNAGGYTLTITTGVAGGADCNNSFR